MIRFKFVGHGPTTFHDGGVGEVGPDDEFAVPDELAVSFGQHGHCECLEPEKLAALIDALPDDRAEGIRPPRTVQDTPPAADAQRRTPAKKKPDTSDPAAAAQ